MTVGTKSVLWRGALFCPASVPGCLGVDAPFWFSLGPAAVGRLRIARYWLPGPPRHGRSIWRRACGLGREDDGRTIWSGVGRRMRSALPVLEPPHGPAHQPPLSGGQAGVRAGSGMALLADGSVDGRVGRIHDALAGATSWRSRVHRRGSSVDPIHRFRRMAARVAKLHVALGGPTSGSMDTIPANTTRSTCRWK